MQLVKRFKKTKNFKIIVGICLFALIFNFSLARAEDVTDTTADSSTPPPASSDQGTGQTTLTPDTSTAPDSGSINPPNPPLEGGQNAENPTPPVTTGENLTAPDSNIPTPLIPPLSGGTVPGDISTASTMENPTPPTATTTAPAIFDFSPSAPSTNSGQDGSGQVSATGTPESNGSVAGASDTGSSTAPILHDVITGITRDANIKGLTILAQWQMSNEKTAGQYLGKDDSALAGSQFLPSGQFQVDKPVTVCALVADAGGAAVLNSISASINYPSAVAKSIDQTGKTGCGQLKSTVNLEKQTAADATALVCDKLRNNNNNLLAWGSDKTDNLVYSYENVCGQDGLLAKNAAELYCAETSLAYDDPAGDYTVNVTAKNQAGAEVTGEDNLKYLELTTFENDFSEILYGPVKVNELKTLKGDLDFGTNPPTVRNTGNTRAQIKIQQNDFGLGKTGSDWNLTYQARVGTSTAFIGYSPETVTALNGVLELGQTSDMDFSILVNRFPDSDAAFWGKMTLSADKAPALNCQ